MDSFGKIVEILITVILIFFIPIQYMAWKQEEICRNYMETETSYFVDEVRNLGYMTDKMYLTFCKKINSVAGGLKVEMEHYKYCFDLVDEEENKDNTKITKKEENIREDNTKESDIVYTEHYKVMYQSDILNELDSKIKEGEKARYCFRQGDYFKIKVSCKELSIASSMQKILLRENVEDTRLKVIYGGMIRDEAY